MTFVQFFIGYIYLRNVKRGERNGREKEGEGKKNIKEEENIVKDIMCTYLYNFHPLFSISYIYFKKM